MIMISATCIHGALDKSTGIKPNDKSLIINIIFIKYHKIHSKYYRYKFNVLTLFNIGHLILTWAYNRNIIRLLLLNTEHWIYT